MTIDTPLTCYICGKTSDEFMTVDMLGCLKNQEAAEKRFVEKFNFKPDGYLFICSECREKNRTYARNIEKKYGIYS